MPDSPAVGPPPDPSIDQPDPGFSVQERVPPGKHTLKLLVAPIILLVIASNVGDALATTLATTNPLALIALNARTRNLVLVTNQLDALSYYTVATVRLLVSDPLFFLLGYWYGDAAVRWMEKRTRTFGDTLRQVERWFGKAAYPLVFLMPNNYICLFAGAAGMSVTGFFVTNIAGTVVRLYLIRRLGEAFEAPIDDLLGFLADYRIPLLVASVGLVLVVTMWETRKGSGEVDALLKLDDDLGLTDDDAGSRSEGPPPAP